MPTNLGPWSLQHDQYLPKYFKRYRGDETDRKVVQSKQLLKSSKATHHIYILYSCTLSKYRGYSEILKIALQHNLTVHLISCGQKNVNIADKLVAVSKDSTL